MFFIENLVVTQDKKKLINGLDLKIRNSTITCIIAPNGTGKTTLFKAITNNLKKVTGTIKINEDENKKRTDFNKQVFFLEDTQNLISTFTGLENLVLIKKLWNSNINIEKTIQLLEMEDFKEKKVNKMSLGMKQKLLIASAIVSNANILIFDEPLNGLDLKNIDLIMRTFLRLKNEGKVIILSSHNVYDTTKICDDIYFLHKGKLLFTESNFDLIKEKYFELFN